MNDPFASLVTIRDSKSYSSRNASKGAMLPELNRLLLELVNGSSRENARNLVVVENVLNKKTFDNRETVWKRLSYRYFIPGNNWIIKALVKANAGGLSSMDFLSLAYLYYAIRDRITFDFVTSVIWNKWQTGSTNVSAGDFLHFLESVEENASELKGWRKSTREKMASITLTALRDFGLLRGTAIKQIQRPTISSEAAYHLLAILWSEGKRGRAIFEATDWRLFLWRESDISDAFIRLAQLGWITFERSGSTVILDIVRLPEVESGNEI
jgi:hypothetical protein